jgi:pentatricopeptide repeat protein
MVFSDFSKQDGGPTHPKPPRRRGRAGKESSSQRDTQNMNSQPMKIAGQVRKQPDSFRSGDSEELDRPTKRKRSPVSQEALELSEQLKELSRQKNLEEALRVYRDPENSRILDGHHACIIIDCCARCGRIAEGEKIVEEMKKTGKPVNVETKTAMIKGFAHSGQMAKADLLFQSMCNEKGRASRPNVRTLNTLLRGCLWSASNVDKEGVVTGGVVTAEKAWGLCRDIQENDSQSILFDVSSYEYSISLLCQALRTNDAQTRIEEMKSFFQVSDGSKEIPQSVSEVLALSFLSLARAFAILGGPDDAKTACEKFHIYARSTRESLKAGNLVPSKVGRHAVKQGKDSGGRRDESNSLYRNHRINEAEKEARVILDLCNSKGLIQDPRQLARRLVTRLLVLSGGGSTDAEGEDRVDKEGASRSAQMQFLNTLYYSYGLKAILDKMDPPTKDGMKFLKRKDCNRILGSIGLQGGIVLDDGSVDVGRIFRVGIGEGKGKKKQGRLEIELGSGFGDWIVQKAREQPATNFISVELRADRVGQTFARTAILAGTTPVNNLCIVGAESSSFLSQQVKQESVSSIFVNHPEPPTQTYGADSFNLKSIMNGGTEPAHMLTSQMLQAAARCLSRKEGSRLIIVTDNKWYGRLICATLAKVMLQEESLLFPVKLEDNFTAVESFHSDPEQAGLDSAITLYEGQPNDKIGHVKPVDQEGGEGATYFDRLWRSGAGSHAEKSSRFIIVASRSSTP